MNIKQVIEANMKAVIVVVGIVLVGIAAWYVISNREPVVGFYTVSKGNVVSSVNVPGTVSSSNSVGLSFQESGQIAAVYVKEGESVTQGQILASLDSSVQQTQLSQEKSTLAGAQANYQKLMTGATAQDIQTSKDAVSSAQQNLDNTYSGSINTLSNAYTGIYNAYTTVNTLQDKYFTGADQPSFMVKQDEANINSDVADAKTYLDTAQSTLANSDVDTAITKIIADLNDAYGNLITIRQQCDIGTYYLTISAADKATIDTQKADISTMLATVTSLQSTIASENIALQQAQDQLSVITAPPTQADIDLAKAQVASAQAQIQNAQLTISNAAIVAPFSGMVWNVVGQPGMVVSPNAPVLSIVNNGILKFDAYAPQTDVPEIQANASAQVMLDTYGSSVTFPAKVTAVDTAATMLDGSPAYHVTLYFTQPDNRIGAGMTGNVMIMSAEHDSVIQIPSRLILTDGNNNYVRMQNGTMRQVTLGLTGDTGMVEIVSGLSVGEKISDF